MLGTIDHIAGWADDLRAVLLRTSLRYQWPRRVFRDRSQRLFWLFLGAVGIYLPLAVFCPLLVLAIGPVMYGVPHLLASLRYVSRITNPEPSNHRSIKQSMAFASALFAAVAAYRIYCDAHGTASLLGESLLTAELISLVITFSGFAMILRHNRRALLLGVCVLIPFIYTAWSAPLWVSGAMVLAHNFVAFAYWIATSKTKPERRAAWCATTIFCLVSTAMMLGAFDNLYTLYSPTPTLHWAGLRYDNLGRMIAPWSKDYHVWFHMVTAYAFGQSMHYFVWLKAIPDQCHHRVIPTTFRQSWKLFLRDFGPRCGQIAALVVLASLSSWVLLEFQQAQTMYFSIAAYHGYLEIAGLGLLRWKASAT